MIELAAIRPDDWNFPLFLHVLGAFTLVGALVTAASFLLAARRDGTVASTRLGYRVLLLGALPSYLVMRISAQWIASKEGLEDSEQAWITLGYASTEGGLLMLVAATAATGLAVRRASRAGSATVRGRPVSLASGLVAFLIVVYMVMIWVMATKPT